MEKEEEEEEEEDAPKKEKRRRGSARWEEGGRALVDLALSFAALRGRSATREPDRRGSTREPAQVIPTVPVTVVVGSAWPRVSSSSLSATTATTRTLCFSLYMIYVPYMYKTGKTR